MQTVPSIPSSIKCAFKTSKILTGFLLQHLKKHFESSDTFALPDLSDCLDNSGDSPGVWVDIPTRENLTNTQHRPMILVKRGEKQYYYHQKNGLADANSAGAQVFNRQEEVTYAIICIGDNSTIVEDLLSELDIFFMSHSVELCREAGLFRLIVQGISAVTTLKEHEDNYIGSLNLQISYGQGVKLQIESLPIREIKQEVNLD